MKISNDSNDFLVIQETSNCDLFELFRVVGKREEKCIRDTKMFIPGQNSLEGRQFACTLSEVLKYAKTDNSKVVPVKVIVVKKILSVLDFSGNIDTNVFVNGVYTVQPEVNAIFNSSIISIEFLERL